MTDTDNSISEKYKKLALSVFFLISGFCFTSWTSRIPTIKANFGLNEAELGNLLMVLPLSSLVGLPVSGWLVSRFESRIPLGIGFIFYSLSLIGIGFANSIFTLICSVFVFAFSMRIFNISVNTQSITIQKILKIKTNGKFHALWSFGGMLGILFTTWMVKLEVTLGIHMTIVTSIVILIAAFSYSYLLRNDIASTGNKLILGKPDKFILSLGLIVFLSAICEGGMFDWSGVYFRDVVKQELFTIGYLVFMLFMAISRYGSDALIEKIGLQKTYFLSATFIFLGISIVILFPYYWPVLIGFSITGIGVASVIPMTYSLAGHSKKYSPGMAISLITTYSIVGMLIGPSLVGYIAHWLSLKYSFVLFVVCGLLMIPFSANAIAYLKRNE